MVIAWILSAVFIVSAISLIGVFTFGRKSKAFDSALILFVGFAAGGLIGGAFLHLLPEALKEQPGNIVFLYALIGFVAFFCLERYFHWRHCHEGNCDIHAFTYLNLVGDGAHNFIDGMVIAASFMTDIKLGIATTLAVILHEIPQEIGDFGILIYGGFSRSKALLFNFICALMAVLGAVIGYALSNMMGNVSLFLIPFTAGGFIYIASSDLIPELHKQKNASRANMAFLTFLLGLGFMALVKLID
ncbi:MAG: ZIP family metal transporter [Candidatus Omnitrophota bacterium]